jgi:hypothetical protein
MFAPTSNIAVAPVTTAVFSVPVAGVDISTYLSDFKATDPNTVATIGSMVVFLATHGMASATAQSSINTLKLFRPGAAAAILALCAPPAVDVQTDNAQNIRAIISNDGSAVGWLYNLINAAKKKSLTDSNVEGFFAMLGHVGTKASAVASLINRITPFYPDSVGDQAFRDLLVEGIWTTYRVNRVSAGPIMIKLLDNFRELGITVQGDATEVAIIAANAATWDTALSLAIPSKFKAYASIYLEVCGTGIDDWWQGNKAVDELPAVRVRGAKVIFKKYLALKNNTDDVDAINTIANLTAAGANFF